MLLSWLTMSHEMLVAYYVDESQLFHGLELFLDLCFSETRLLYNQERHSLQPKKLMIFYLGQSYMYFNPLVFWYQWEKLLTSKDFLQFI